MKPFLKAAGIAFDALVGIIVIGFAVIYFKSKARLTRIYELPLESVV